MQDSSNAASRAELIGKVGGSLAKLLAATALGAVGIGLLIIAGLLGEKILGAFSISAALKFQSPIGSWIGRHFLDIVKIVLWTVALQQLYTITIKVQRKWPAVIIIATVVTGLGFGVGLTTKQCPLVIPLGLAVLLSLGKGLSKSNVLTLAWRELKSWLLHPMGYVVAAGFAVMSGRMFIASMSELTAIRPDNPLAIQPLATFLASDFFAVALLILTAIITMRLLAGERERGTIELLYSLPLKDWEIVLGKFIGAWGFFCLVILVSLAHMAIYGALGNLDYRQILSSYVGLSLVGMAFVAVGLFCSCLVRNQVVAALLVLLVLGISIFLGDIVSFVGVTGGRAVGGWTEYTSLMPHLNWAARGSIDSRTILAMGSVCGMSLFAAFVALRAHRQGIFWNVFESYTSTNWIQLLVGIALAGATLLFLQTHLSGRYIVESAMLIWSAVLMGLAWGPICHSRLAGNFSKWRFILVVATAPAVVAVALLAGVFPDAVRRILAVLIAMIAAALLIPRLYQGQLRDRLSAMGNIVVALICVLTINVTGNYLAIKHHEAMDISTGQAFSLSPEAKRIFEQQVKDGERVDVYCLVSSSTYAGQHDAARRNLLERELRIFAEAVNHPGNVKLTYQFLDPAEDSGQIGRLINQYDVGSNRQVLLVYRNRQYILDDRDLFELFPDKSRMAEFRTNWQTMFERSGAQIPPPPKTNEQAFMMLEKWVENSPAVAEQAESYLALRAKGDFQQKMTEAVLRLVQEDKIQQVCFTQGHGEVSLLGGQGNPNKANGLRRMLRQYNYVVKEIKETQIPPNCAVLVILGPTKRFSAKEIDTIDQYIKGGGKVFVLIDPGHDGGLGKLFGRYGITSPDNQAVAFNQSNTGGGQLETKVGVSLQPRGWQQRHPIVEYAWKGAQARGRRGFIVADGVRQVQKRPDADEIKDYFVTELLQVPQGYTASNDTSEVPTSMDGQTRGPYPFAVIAERLRVEPADGPRKKPTPDDVDHDAGKLLVIGDSDMFTDKPILLGYGLNGEPMTAELFHYPGASNDDLAPVAIGYLARNPEKVAEVTPKEHQIYVSDEMKKAYRDSRNSIGLLLWLVLPGVLLLAGLGVWIARRS
ncbi:MAG: ABC transporter permease [Actinobacteria bacterium]|nr:ABC transporter permease [Actinomycetota bacterium]